MHSDSRFSDRAGLCPSHRDRSEAFARRLDWLDAFARILAAHHEELVALVERELGKPRWETLVSEIHPLVASIRWHRRNLVRLVAPRPLRGRAWWQFGQRHWRMRAPVGRVAIIATWNYPLQILGIQLVQAIASGNRVCVKPSERSPRTQSRLLSLAAAAAREAGLAEDTLEWRDAARSEGERLLREEDFDHVLFTGSTSVGRAIAELAATRLIPTTLELSGQDSAFVLGDADVVLAARTLWRAITMNAGQTCMAPRRILVESRCYARFLSAFATRVAAARPVALVDEAAAAVAFEAARDAIGAGGRSITGTLEAPESRALRPIAIGECPVETALFQGEHFGPVVAIRPVDSLDEGLALHRRCGQALAVSVFTRSVREVRRRAAEFASSAVTINDCVLPTVHPASSIAGRGASGWGSSRGESGLLALTREVTVSTTSPRWRIPDEPPTERAQAWIRRALGPAAWRDVARATPPIPIPEALHGS